MYKQNMMKALEIRKIHAAVTAAVDVPAVLDNAGIDFERIDRVDWPAEFPYKPLVTFRLAHTGSHILLHYRVEEQTVRAVASRDNDSVWEDSCCEFFIQPEAAGAYYNIETNCAATVLLAHGKGREQRQHAAQAVLDTVLRWSSLGRTPFEEQTAPPMWEMALVIPTTVFFANAISDLSGRTMRGNFYKCGDKLSVPHFLSWAPIDTPSPDFHRPEFFGLLHFLP